MISGWGAVAEESNTGFNYSETVFRDYVWANDQTYNPVPVFTVSGPPFTYTTLIQSASHKYYVGTNTFSGGTQVFNGNIYYFKDHGDTF